MIAVRRARPSDAPLIGAVHVAAWRSAYPGILPEDYLAGLSVTRQAAYYDRQIRGGGGVYVAIASGQDVPSGAGPRLVGYTTVGRSAVTLPGDFQGDGEIETLYVLDDWRERGVGRRLIRTGAAHLAAAGSRAAFLWVLRSNPKPLVLPAFGRAADRRVGDACGRHSGAASGVRVGPDRAPDRGLAGRHNPGGPSGQIPPVFPLHQFSPGGRREARLSSFCRCYDGVQVAAHDGEHPWVIGDH